MSSKIKAVDVVPDEVKEEPTVEENKPIIEEEVEQVKEEEKHEEVEPEIPDVQEIIEEASEKPEASRKMATCPDCGKKRC